MKRLPISMAIVLFLLAVLAMCAPDANTARAQGVPPTPAYVDYLSTQIAVNAQATASAWGQQGSAAQANANAAAIEAQAAALAQQAAAARAQAAAVSAQATEQANQQMMAAQQAQATSDAAALRATVVAQSTADALIVRATAQAIDALATEQAVMSIATRTAIEQRNSDMAAMSTQVAVSAQATITAQRVVQDNALADAETGRNVRSALGVLVVVLTSAGVILVLRWMSRRLSAPSPAQSIPPSTASAAASSAAQSVVDAETGRVSRLPAIVFDDDGYKQLEKYLRMFDGPTTTDNADQNADDLPATTRQR